MKDEGVDNEITGNSLRARSREKRIDRAPFVYDNQQVIKKPYYIGKKSNDKLTFEKKKELVL